MENKNLLVRNFGDFTVEVTDPEKLPSYYRALMPPCYRTRIKVIARDYRERGTIPTGVTIITKDGQRLTSAESTDGIPDNLFAAVKPVEGKDDIRTEEQNKHFHALIGKIAQAQNIDAKDAKAIIVKAFFGEICRTSELTVSDMDSLIQYTEKVLKKFGNG